jgi:hypothetical protein
VGVAPGTVVVVVVPGTVVGVEPGMVVDFWLRSRDGYMYIQQRTDQISVHMLSSTEKSIARK